MMILVRESFLIASFTAFSRWMSRALVASSRNRIEGFL
jgi:predicted MarR family transcription regulator